MTKPASGSTAGGDATWGAQPASGDWNTNANWVPASVPTGSASFGMSSQTQIGFAPNSQASVDSITFVAGAAAYTILFNAPAPTNPMLTITGGGISNASGVTQQFIVASSAVSYTQAQLKFINAASAGGPDVQYIAGPATPAAPGGGVIGFWNNSTAGAASFIVKTGAGTPVEPSTVGGEVSFSNSSSAGTAQFMIYGSTSPTDGDTFGNVVFHDTASAANGVYTNLGGTVPGTAKNGGGDGGNTQFYDNATAA